MKNLSKSGEYSTITHNKNKRERKRPLTPEERKLIVDHVEAKIKKSKQLFQRDLGDEIEWTKEEIEWQKRSLKPDNTKELSAKNKEKLNIFCLHKKGTIKDGYMICTKCNGRFKVRNDIGISK